MTSSVISARRAGPGSRVVNKRPSLRIERALQRDGASLLAGMDEVGRGALAGPVSVGVVLIDASSRSAPTGVKDSKLLSGPRRKELVPRIRRWCRSHGVGHASAAEIDEIGIMAALRLAGLRALAQLDTVPDLIILDGNHDWLTAPEDVGLFAMTGDGPTTPPVTTMIKADLKCSSVAAASVLAKVTRDDLMVELGGEHPAYNWGENKGYSAPDHLEALRVHGPCVLHRRSWRLPGVMVEDGCAPGVAEAPEHGVPLDEGLVR